MKLTIVTVLVMFSVCAFSQSKVSGLANYEDGNIAEFCTFELLQVSDSSFVKGYIGDTLGTFYFEDVLPGEYMVRTSQYGYEDHYTEPFSVESNSNIALDPVVLKLMVSDLDAVQVTAYRPMLTYRDGALIINVENDLMSSGSSVLDMLRRVPGVVVDDNGNILVNGKSGVGIMFDGRLQQIPTAQLIAMMDNVSADAISTIELIKNPPANYDAKGISGLINITSKTSSVNGVNGSIDQTGSMGRKFRSATTGTFNLKSNRVSVFTNISYQYKNLWTETDFDRTIGSDSPLLINSLTNGSAVSSGLNFNAGFEYDLSPRTMIGLNLSGSLARAEIENGTRTDLSDSTGIGYDYFEDETGGDEDQKYGTVNLFLAHNIDSLGSNFKYSGDYTYYNYLYPQLNTNSFFGSSGDEIMSSIGYRSTSDLEFKILTNSLDYTKVFRKAWELQAGLKWSNVRSNNLLQLETNTAGGSFSLDSSLTNLYDYSEDVYAGYVSGKKSFEKIMFTLGVRAEQTVINGQNRTHDAELKRSYLNFFPNMSIDFQPNEKSMMQLSYSYRIDRPGFQQIIPGRIFANQLSYLAGSPGLNPQYSHNVNFEHFYNYTLGNSIGYTRINNSIYEYTYTQAGQVSVDTTINFASKDMINYTLYFQKQFAKWYRVQLTGLAMFSALNGEVGNFNVSTQTVALACQMNNDFLLPKGFKIQFSGRFTGPFTEGVITQSARGSMDLAIRKKFFDNKLSTVLGFSDILFSDFGSTTMNLTGQSSVILPKRDSRRVTVSIVYRFGSVRVDRKNKPTEGNDRIKTGEE